MPSRRIRLRPPGIKPWTRIGTLGPFRGRLGLSWMLAALVVGLVLVVVGWIYFARSGAPGGSFQPVGKVASWREGTGRPAGLPGVFVGRTGGTMVAVLQEDGCGLRFDEGRYVDCRGVAYALTGRAPGGCGALDLLPVALYHGEVYVDPDHPLDRSPAPAPSSREGCP
jgi:hypothetical protein